MICVSVRRLSQRLPLMAGLTAVLRSDYPQSLRPLLGRWLLQAVTRRGLGLLSYVESRLPFQRDDPPAQAPCSLRAASNTQLKVGARGPVHASRKG